MNGSYNILRHIKKRGGTMKMDAMLDIKHFLPVEIVIFPKWSFTWSQFMKIGLIFPTLEFKNLMKVDKIVSKLWRILIAMEKTIKICWHHQFLTFIKIPQKNQLTIKNMNESKISQFKNSSNNEKINFVLKYLKCN